MSNIQDSTASSTPEAEIVAADTVLRTLLILALDLWGDSTRKYTSHRNTEGRQGSSNTGHGIRTEPYNEAVAQGAWCKYIKLVCIVESDG